MRPRFRAHAHPGSTTIRVHMVGDRKTGRLLGVQMVGNEGVWDPLLTAANQLLKKMEK